MRLRANGIPSFTVVSGIFLVFQKCRNQFPLKRDCVQTTRNSKRQNFEVFSMKLQTIFESIDFMMNPLFLRILRSDMALREIMGNLGQVGAEENLDHSVVLPRFVPDDIENRVQNQTLAEHKMSNVVRQKDTHNSHGANHQGTFRATILKTNVKIQSVRVRLIELREQLDELTRYYHGMIQHYPCKPQFLENIFQFL